MVIPSALDGLGRMGSVPQEMVLRVQFVSRRFAYQIHRGGFSTNGELKMSERNAVVVVYGPCGGVDRGALEGSGGRRIECDRCGALRHGHSEGYVVTYELALKTVGIAR